MKKELFVHLLATVVFFIIITILNRFFSLYYWPLWVGGIIGTFLPEIDHLIYVYYLQPNDINSQRFVYLKGQGNLIKAFEILATSRGERTKLIFHTVLFQLIFLVLTYLVVSTSGSLFAVGLVIAFSLHLLVDQFTDLMKLENLNIWFRSVNLEMNKEKSLFYWLGVMGVLIFISTVIL